MNWIAALRPKADAGLLLAARASQALAIESMDRALAVGKKSHVVPTELFKRLNSGIGSLLVGDPATFVDDTYDLAQRLVELHREFAQRLVDVLDPRPAVSAVSTEPASGVVVPFRSRTAQSGR